MEVRRDIICMPMDTVIVPARAGAVPDPSKLYNKALRNVSSRDFELSSSCGVIRIRERALFLD